MVLTLSRIWHVSGSVNRPRNAGVTKSITRLCCNAPLTFCKRFVHYKCTGLSIQELSEVINQEPGIYVGKCCIEEYDTEDRDYLLRHNPGNTFFKFQEDRPPQLKTFYYTKSKIVLKTWNPKLRNASSRTVSCQFLMFQLPKTLAKKIKVWFCWG